MDWGRDKVMRAYIFSIGEKTTDLCSDLMLDMGFDVILYEDDTSLWAKLKRFYTDALQTNDESFIRIDADIIPNRNVLKLEDSGWECASGYDWYKQDRGAISIHRMTRPIIEMCLENIAGAKDKTRPETHLWRHPDINPHTQIRAEFGCGIHGYAQQDQRDRIKELKDSRHQDYNWDLVERIESL